MGLIIGCFAPVVYGVYKAYETSTTQTITLLVHQPPDTVWAEVISTTRENQVHITRIDNKERFLEGDRKDGIKGYSRVITGPDEKVSLEVEDRVQGAAAEEVSRGRLHSAVRPANRGGPPPLSFQGTEANP